MEEKKFYITTALPYMNGTLHIGHAYEFVFADIIARYHRAQGERTLLLTGADEHGDKIIASAQKEGMGPQAFVDGNVLKFKTLLERLAISNDLFIRTSDKEHHWPGAIKLWRDIRAAGDIYKGVYQGLYCVGCEAFITEKELVDGKCPLHNTVPEHIEEENYFFKLSKYAPEIKRLLESGELKVTPQSKANEMLALLDSELSDVSISRPERAIPWGIPVPDDPSQLMYVWCDALSNYISALGYGRLPPARADGAQAGEDDEEFRTFWPADLQVIGKDIARFHIILWPALLLAANVPLPRELFVHGFITSAGKKMSKSIGNVLSAEEFIDIYGTDALRYYFAREIVPTDDGDLTHEKFKEVYNANLANGLGNLVSRTLKMAERYFGGRVAGAPVDALPLKTHIALAGELGDLAGLTIPYLVQSDILPRYHTHMRAHEVNKAADVVWELFGMLDQYITDYEPFKLVKEDLVAAEQVLWSVLFGLREAANLIAPFMPETAEKVAKLLGAMDEGGMVVFSSRAPETPLFMRKD